MRVWVTGSKGMLGKAVAAAAFRGGHELTASDHAACSIDNAGMVFRAVERIKPDVIINCAGRLPGSDPLDMVNTNTLGPHVLASTGVRLVHMSTDCVFSGKGRNRWLSSLDRPDPEDLYGRTKLAGEPENALVVRGSFIGKDGGFLRWLLDAQGPVDAWTKALWNGFTVEAMANVLVYLAGGRRSGVIHVASEEAMSKAEMVDYFVQKLDLPITGIRYMDEPRLDRRLEPDPSVQVVPLSHSLSKLVEELCPVLAGRCSS